MPFSLDTIFDPDLIPLQHLVKGSANVATTGSAFNGPKVNLGEVAAGLLPKIFTDLIHNIFHIHCDITPLSFADTMQPCSTMQWLGGNCWWIGLIRDTFDVFRTACRVPSVRRCVLRRDEVLINFSTNLAVEILLVLPI
jgi:hypothetical protein